MTVFFYFYHYSKTATNVPAILGMLWPQVSIEFKWIKYNMSAYFWTVDIIL